MRAALSAASSVTSLVGWAVAVIPLLALAGPLLAQPLQSAPTLRSARPVEMPPVAVDSAHHRWAGYAHDVASWSAVMRVLGSSGYDQWAPSPKVWPRTAESFGRRFVTRSAQLVAIESARHGLAAALHHETGYLACACTAPVHRVRHAILGTLTDLDASGRRPVAWPRFAGAFAGAYVLGRLQPQQGSLSTVTSRALGTIGLSALGNLAREFGLPGMQRTEAAGDAREAPPREPRAGVEDTLQQRRSAVRTVPEGA